ncbi:hypothetical protein [Paramicrobacterium fandaimingii]|uniref:hypothetical protein n=1 Tax=Paramicrobacterium fandaimingii TaxID=2708079 RepID=UPI00141E5459|nr:hypothetical protein [Microbacterium fandaimingii]
MPLIKQQDVISVVGSGHDRAILELKKVLKEYPPVKVVAISTQDVLNPLGRGALAVRLTAVVETV